jgi:hypothetical protein
MAKTLEEARSLLAQLEQEQRTDPPRDRYAAHRLTVRIRVWTATIRRMESAARRLSRFADGSGAGSAAGL